VWWVAQASDSESRTVALRHLRLPTLATTEPYAEGTAASESILDRDIHGDHREGHPSSKKTCARARAEIRLVKVTEKVSFLMTIYDSKLHPHWKLTHWEYGVEKTKSL
jgi:hypothetical protein